MRTWKGAKSTLSRCWNNVKICGRLRPFFKPGKENENHAMNDGWRWLSHIIWIDKEHGFHSQTNFKPQTIFNLSKKGKGFEKARFVFYWLKHIALLLVEDSLLCFTFLTNRRFLPPLIFRHLSPFLSRPHLVWTFTHKYVRFWYIMIYSNGNSIFIIFATHLIFPFKCLQIQSLSLITLFWKNPVGKNTA